MPLVAPFPFSVTLPATAPVESLAKAIQLSVAPVFLLAGVSGLLGVFTNRLARIIERARLLQDQSREATVSTGRRVRV